MSTQKRPAGPGGGIFGIQNLLDFQKDTLGFVTRVHQQYGELSHFRMTFFHFYMISSPEFIHETLIKQREKIEKWKRQTDTWSKAVGASTLTMEGEEWKRHRRLLNPPFQPRSVIRYHDLILEHTNRLLDHWQEGGTYEMMFEMMRTTMGIICEIVFSVKDIENEAAELNQALTSVFEVLTARTVAFQSIPLWIPTPENLRIRKASKTIETFILNLIRTRRTEGVHHDDLLSDLILAKDEETGATLSDLEICYEMKTLFGAGHETTALMLMWTLYLLAQHPDIQEKAHQEAVEVLGERDPIPEDLQKLTYTEQVINESMRLYPPAWSLMVRYAKEDLPLGDHTIPAGSVLLLPMWVVQRSEKVFDDPLRFDPQRFAGDWRKGQHKYAYFPFGGGPHACLGSSLSVFEGKLILPMILRRFRFELVPQPEIQLQALLTLRPKNGLLLKAIKR